MATETKYKTMIIDDEYPARLMLRKLASDRSNDIEIIAEAKNGSEAVELICLMRPDLIFLDINMPGKNGFEIISSINYEPLIIFTTAYEEFAVRAFETNAVDYLLKPIEENRFAASIEKLRRFNNGNVKLGQQEVTKMVNKIPGKRKITALPVRKGDKIIIIRLEDISYIEAKDKYVFAATAENKEHLSDTRLSEFEDILPENFMRVQKSFIINKDRIIEIHRYFGNRLIITMDDKNKTRITTGITYINKIRENLGL